MSNPLFFHFYFWFASSQPSFWSKSCHQLYNKPFNIPRDITIKVSVTDTRRAIESGVTRTLHKRTRKARCDDTPTCDGACNTKWPTKLIIKQAAVNYRTSMLGIHTRQCRVARRGEPRLTICRACIGGIHREMAVRSRVVSYAGSLVACVYFTGGIYNIAQ